MATNPGDKLDKALRKYYWETFSEEANQMFMDHIIHSGKIWGIQLRTIRQILLSLDIYHDTSPAEIDHILRRIRQRS